MESKMATKYIRINKDIAEAVKEIAVKEFPVGPGKGNESMAYRELIREALEARRANDVDNKGGA